MLFRLSLKVLITPALNPPLLGEVIPLELEHINVRDNLVLPHPTERHRLER
jgi:hypothetical protein